jgi:hypothetical protein
MTQTAGHVRNRYQVLPLVRVSQPVKQRGFGSERGLLTLLAHFFLRGSRLPDHTLLPHRKVRFLFLAGGPILLGTAPAVTHNDVESEVHAARRSPIRRGCCPGL